MFAGANVYLCWLMNLFKLSIIAPPIINFIGASIANKAGVAKDVFCVRHVVGEPSRALAHVAGP
jgi:hypothetical protein